MRSQRGALQKCLADLIAFQCAPAFLQCCARLKVGQHSPSCLFVLIKNIMINLEEYILLVCILAYSPQCCLLFFWSITKTQWDCYCLENPAEFGR